MPVASGRWVHLLVLAGAPVAAALVGGVLGAVGSGRRNNTSAARYIVYFAAGAFLAVALLDLLPEAASEIGWPVALLSGAAGWGAASLLATWAGGFCPGCDIGDHGPDSVPSPASLSPFPMGLPLLAAISIHAGLDGLALMGGSGRPKGAELLTLAVLVHKLPEGMAIAAVNRSEGRSPLAAIGVTALVEAATFVGLFLGVLLGGGSRVLLGVAVGAVAGSFLFLVGYTVRTPGLKWAPTALTAGAGVLLIVAAHVLLGAVP